MSEAELKRNQKTRSVTRRYVKKIIENTEKVLRDGDEEEANKLLTNKEILIEQLADFKEIDIAIVCCLQESKLDDEIFESKDFAASTRFCIAKIEARLNSLVQRNEPLKAKGADTPTKKTSRRIAKLPQLKLKVFTGSPIEWPSFWEIFRAAIDSDESMENVVKFSYLKAHLEGAESDAIAGLKVSNATHSEALELLRARFGDDEIIISTHMDKLLNIPAVESLKDIKKLRETYDRIETHVRSLGALGVPATGYQQLLAPIIVNKLPSELRIAITRKVKDSDLSKILESFNEEVQVREKCVLSRVAVARETLMEGAKPRWTARNNIATTATLYTEQGVDSEQIRSVKCAYCDGAHKSHSCRTVTDHQVRKKILSQKNRCFICLRPGHVARNCHTNMRCLKCNQRHHSTICDCYSKETMSEKRSNTGSAREKSSDSLANSSQSTTNMHINAKNSGLLQTARVRVKSPQEQQSRTVRLILDSGSQKSYVTREIKDALGLPVIGKDKLLIKTFGKTSPKITTCEIVQFTISCKDGTDFTMQAYVVPVICTPISNQVVSLAVEKYDHLRKIELADYCERDELESDKKVGILVGADYYRSLVRSRVIRGERGGPVAMETKVGWVVSGPTEMVSESLCSFSLKIDSSVIERNDYGLVNEIKNFWNNESIGIKSNTLEQGAIEKFKEEVKFIDNRYEIKLPFKEGHSPVPDNYSLSQKRLARQLNRLKEDKEIAQKYDDVITEQLREGIIERVTKEDCAATSVGTITYLPHQHVLRPDKETTKLRVVFDASAKHKGEGLSLNDVLDPGPSVLPLLYDILLRFRAGTVVLIGDIEKAFLNISITPEYRDFLCFLWVDDVNSTDPEVVTYRFGRLCFRLVSSPFLLNATVRHHMAKYVKKDPPFIETVLNSLYCDDFVGTLNDESEAFLLFEKLKARFAEGAFNMRKWVSNSKAVLDKIHESEEITPTQSLPEIKVLGFMWNAETDQMKFEFSAMIGKIDNIVTKRVVLATTAKLFDLLGLISPVIVPLKLVFQQLCKEKSDWDFPCSNSILKLWFETSNDMLQTGQICFDRFYLPRRFDSNNIYFVDLHGFCDASLNAYGGCVYIVYQLMSGERFSRLVAAKHVKCGDWGESSN